MSAEADFAIATLGRSRGRSEAALRVDGRFWPLALAGLPQDAMRLFDDWPRSLRSLERFAAAIRRGRYEPDQSVSPARARLLTPLRYPRKLFCVGANYADHLAEMNASITKVPGRPPFFFMKPASTAIVGPGDRVLIPPGCQVFDWEVEFVVVFGRGGRDISQADAMSHVAGYSLGIDFTARDLFDQPTSFFRFNFALGKGQDTMSPLGPVVVPAQFIDLARARFGLSVNGVRKQWGSTGDMIYSVPEQIAGVSQAVTIEPGDVMYTGSPAGVGLPRGERLVPGDVVTIFAEGVGEMSVTIDASPAAG